MKIIGNTLETIHNFRHKYVPERVLDDPFLAARATLAVRDNVTLQLLYLDTNNTFYLAESTTSMAHGLQYNEGAVVVREWTPADFVAQKRSYGQPGFDNYFQLLVNNTAEAILEQQENSGPMA
jgi:hypothetical protein